MASKEERQFYPGMITEVNSDYVRTIVQVGTEERELSFPRQVLAYHRLFTRGDRFRYFPSSRNELGIFNIGDFEVVELDTTPTILPHNFLKSLCNPSSEDLGTLK
ncbi:MAG: hypothetical protein AABX11_01670 [Nanoarchaeota archaeon]